MRLRQFFRTALVTGGVAVLTTSAFLALLTRDEHRGARDMAAAYQNVRTAKQLEADLLLFHRERALRRLGVELSPDAMRSSAGALEAEIAVLHADADPGAEARTVDRLDTDVQAFVDEWARETRTPDPGGIPKTALLLDRALRDADRVDAVNLGQSQAAHAHVARIDRRANVIAFVTMALAVALAGALLAGVHRFFYRPLLELRASIDRFGRGDWNARAARARIDEFDEIAGTFNAMADALADAHERQLRFVGSVAHDLRNPLQALRLALERAIPDDSSSPGTAALAGRQIDRLERMVRDLLDIARLESGTLELVRMPVDLRTPVREVVRLVSATAPRHRLELVECSKPVTVRCDVDRIEQVVENLIANALKYSPAGSTVRIESRTDGEHGLVAVSDQGIGIDVADLERIFRPFQRTDRSRDVASGIGLGLWTARRIVEAHGGTIQVKSEVGRGSTFRVLIPREPAGEPHPCV